VKNCLKQYRGMLLATYSPPLVKYTIAPQLRYTMNLINQIAFLIHVMHYFSIFLLLFITIKVYSTCNITKFDEWKNKEYTGSLAANSAFWRYQTQSFFVLRNGLAIQLAVEACRNRFKLLYYFKSGKMGPVDDQTIWKQMCHEYCLESDVMHEEAIAYTGCTCLELSTKPDDPSYNIYGDFCLENSGRILCTEMELCGVWNCRIDDFTCPRYEYNKKLTPYKGFGTCVRSAAATSFSIVMTVLSLTFATLLMFI
jgi:hypothetical protein